MKDFEVTLPKLGESIMGATVVSWLVQEGDEIVLDQPLLEVSTDKVNSEIPSPVAGRVQKLLVEEDDEIEIGAPLVLIATDSDVKSEAAVQKEEIKSAPCPAASSSFSPAVLRLAQVEGIEIETLRQIKGSGEGGRITKRDVESFLSAKREVPAAPLEGEERVEMSSMRKAIADNMVRSFYEAPHASLVTEADVTDVMQMIKEKKQSFFETHGVKLTITSFIIQALTKALQKYPLINASLENETIVMKRYINMGLAVHVEKGLVVPVVKNCQDRNIVSLAKTVADLSSRAREQKLAPDDVKDGSITLTNFGMTGALIGVPIIRYPEVAIIGAGTIQKRVVVRDDDSFAVRKMVYLTLTFDHRVIDGIYGCEFLAEFKRQLETISSAS
ncbi:MAG: Dihydrolipoyllysine-residue acetyltransferase component of pyruvate dehydrogenase complex [Chlamydiales bacterium]|nr:Dihydrolipoyllysine-residue acetyltransferase component of pyruvate dehydrogenase complex [Chlamydiales bacterium]MCH9635609.1 Dihydrolipoyllysine-residue acetyltransferase component of pyruvate dehydrogenase complex [Chlamydiales bacterium]MCH9703869.1 2-oxo acid dehydrogenase subunit E2 [Chlamydiota bacterium]